MGTTRGTLKKQKARSGSSPLVRGIKRFLAIGIALGFIGIIFASVVLLNKIQAVKPLVDNIGDKIKEYNSKPSRILSTKGDLLYEIKPIHRESVSLAVLPKHVTNAILAAEDKRFWDHSGVDIKGLLRALIRNGSGQDKSGGSTITMQLAKKLFSASEKNMQRKVQDIAIAIELEKRFTKDQILELYINQIYYGEQAYGLNAAAEIYFGKEAKDLDLAEAAMIARCIRLPSTQNPVKNYQSAFTNKKIVLDTMLEEHWITNDEYEKAKNEKPKVRGLSHQKLSRQVAAPYFVAAVKRDLDKMNINIGEGGYTVYTTLDKDLQETAEKAVERGVRRNEANVGAFICMDAEGRILADVGGRDFNKNQYSYTTQSPLQPGSSFKTFVYAEALKEGLLNSTESEISNEKIKIGSYIPKDHHAPGGSVDLWRAYTQSWNLPAIHTFMNLGKERAASMITEDFGFRSEIKPFPSSALGASEVRAIEMLEAYSVFVLDGKRVNPYRIKEIQGPDGAVVYEGKMEYVSTSIGPGVVETMDRLMRGVVTSGTGREASSCPDAHGKTGTTNDGKSLWFCGYSKGVIGIAVSGNQYYDKKRKKWLLRPMSQFGGDVSAPIWAEAMSAAVEKYGSDVKPDLSKQAESSEMRRKKKEEEPANNDEVPPIDDTNVEPDTNTPKAPGTNDDGTGRGDTPPVTDPQKDPASDPTSTTEPPTKTDTKRPHQSDSDMVEVEVCADSGMLATRYCPETLTRTVAKNKRPKRRCTIHKAPAEGGGG